MNTPTIRYYARMENTTQKGRKTPKYTILEQAGYYPPMEQLRGKDGLVSMNLIPQSREDNSSTPPMRLQAKKSLNFTGLKDYWIEGKLSGFAYGYPSDKPTYSKDEKPNPFYSYCGDGYLFLFNFDKEIYLELENGVKIQIPYYFELIVLEGAKVLISAYCKMLEMGGFDEALVVLRKQASAL